MTLRAIQPRPELRLNPNRPPELDLGSEPEFRWVPPTSLVVDEEYQRGQSAASERLMMRMLRPNVFKWRRFKLPIVVEAPEGLHCIDGQHGAIVAATLGIPLIPVCIVEASTQTERADSFVGHNKERVALTPFDIYKGELKAEDALALEVQAVCERAGVRIRHIQPSSKLRPGDTSALGTVKALVRRQHKERSVKVLQALVQAGRAPITGAEILAMEALMFASQIPDMTVENAARVARVLGDNGLIRAQLEAKQMRSPIKHRLLLAYLTLWKKQSARAA